MMTHQCVQTKNPKRTNFLISQGCCHFLYGLVSKPSSAAVFPSQQPSVLFEDEQVNFLLVAFTCGWMAVSIFVSYKGFHPPSGSAGSHSGIFMHMMKLPIYVYSWVVLDYKELNHCTLLMAILS
jgi:hypothetical protein